AVQSGRNKHRESSGSPRDAGGALGLRCGNARLLKGACATLADRFWIEEQKSAVATATAARGYERPHRVVRARPLCPDLQTPICSAMAMASSTSMPRYLGPPRSERRLIHP